jgi:hypothetical protein
MPYCTNSLIVSAEQDVVNTVSLFAKEQFKALDAHPGDHSQFNIDAGENDARAIVNFEQRQIKVFCRYPEDIERTDLKIVEFVKHHANLCELVAISADKI